MEGEQPQLGALTTHGYQPLTSPGMILQVGNCDDHSFIATVASGCLRLIYPLMPGSDGRAPDKAPFLGDKSADFYMAKTQIYTANMRMCMEYHAFSVFFLGGLVGSLLVWQVCRVVG